MNPRSGRAGQPRVLSQRRHGDPRLLRRHLCANPPNYLSYPVHEQIRALHHSAAQSDRVRSEDGNQVRQPQANVLPLAIHRSPGQLVALARHSADLPGRRFAAAGPLFLHPCRHRRAARQAFPAAARAAITKRAGVIQHLVPDLRMSPVYTPIEFPGENHAGADPRADGHVDEAVASLRGAPTRFGECGGIRVVLYYGLHPKLALERRDDIPALPARQRADVADDPRKWIERTRTCYADSSEAYTSTPARLAQHLACAQHRRGEPFARRRGFFHAREDGAILSHGPHGDLSPTNIDCADDSHGPRAEARIVTLAG